MTDHGLLLYAIVATGGTIQPEPLPNVRLISYEHLAVAVGPAQRETYQGMPRREALLALLTHQQVAERLLDDYTVLPVKFGIVLPHETYVTQLLQHGNVVFNEALRALDDNVQIDIVVRWDPSGVVQDIGEMPAIKHLKTELAGASPDVLKEGQVLLGQRVKEELERHRYALAAQLQPVFATLAQDTVSLPATHDDIVLHMALLLDDVGYERLDEALERLDATYEERLTFQAIGPLPPHSFATVDIKRVSVEKRDAARRLLGLDMTASASTAKAAYYRRARELHPDLHPEDPQASSRMHALTEAYALLADLDDRSCVFEVSHGLKKDVLLLDVKRSTYAAT